VGNGSQKSPSVTARALNLLNLMKNPFFLLIPMILIGIIILISNIVITYVVIPVMFLSLIILGGISIGKYFASPKQKKDES
jgi:hypothetical protein